MHGKGVRVSTEAARITWLILTDSASFAGALTRCEMKMLLWEIRPLTINVHDLSACISGHERGGAGSEIGRALAFLGQTVLKYPVPGYNVRQPGRRGAHAEQG